MAHTVHSVPLSIFRAQGPPDSLLSSCDPPFWCHGFLCHGDIQIQFCNICRNHTSFSIPFEFDWINFTQLINIWYKKNLQGNWTICIIQVPVTHQFIMSWSVIWGVRSSLRSDQNPIIPIYHFDMRSGIWGDRSNIKEQINVRAKIFVWNPLYLLLSSHQFGKGTVDMGFSLLLHTSTKGTMMLLSWSGLSTLITLRFQIRTSSWTFSPASIFQRSPPQLANTFLHFCLKPVITFDTMA